MKYTIGLDLGITSIGWAVIGLDDEGNSTHIVDANVTTLETIEDDKGELKNVERRGARGIRRTIRRRMYRVKRVKDLLNDIGVNVDSIYNIHSKVQLNPYFLKVKGLNETLTSEELAICLIHYVKHRGFKSNRKNKEVADEGDLLASISENKAFLEANNMTVSQFLYSRFLEHNGSDKIKNSTGNYQYLFDRVTYENEIIMLLETQIKSKVITEEFKNKYLEIWSSQRDFSEGPGEPSPYAVDFSKVFGYCKFPIDGETQLRAPRCAPTTEIFTLLQKLNNIRYKEVGVESPQRLNSEEVVEALEVAKSKASISYLDILKIINKDVDFQGLELSKDTFIKLVSTYKEKHGIDRKTNIDFKDEEFKKMISKEKNKIVVGKLANYNKLKKIFKDKGYESIFKELPLEYIDDIVVALTFYKTESRINNYFNQEGEQEHTNLDWNLYPDVILEVVPFIDTFNESAGLSLKLMKKLNELLIEGFDYYEAMKNLGYDHSAPISDTQKSELLPDMNVVLKDFPNELTNPRVTRVISATMAIINSLIKRYGKPTNINVETARDIANIRSKRSRIFNENMNNYEYNQRLKVVIANELKVKPINKVTKDDIERLKLFYEQNEMCMYSFKKIDINKLFSTDLQVDHIVPYSRSFDNSFSNKTLVFTKYNQDKRNRTPYEYFKQDRKDEYTKFVNVVESNVKLSFTKKKNYLIDEINEEFKTRSLNDTSYITKYFIKIIGTYLEIDGEVTGYKAGIVNSLKKSWGLEYLTHSLIHDEYSSKDSSKFLNYEVKSDGIKLEFESSLDAKNIVVEVKKSKVTDKTPSDIVEMNEVIESVCKNPEFLIILKEECSGETIYRLYDYVVKTDKINQALQMSYINIFNQLVIEYNKQQIKKNRDNHLHHVLDAACVAVLNRKFEQRVTKFYQEIENIKNEAKESFDKKLQYTNKYSGAVVNDFDALNRDIDSMWDDKFPKPYSNFDLEVKYRVFEQDEQKQKELFGKNFNDGLTRNIRPVFPVYKAIKRKTMKLHKETYYGCMEFEDGKYLTKRIDVADLTKKNIEKVVEIKRGNKKLEDILTNWLNNKLTDYPLLPNGRPIKKLKIIDREAEKSFKIAEGKHVAIDKTARVDIYKSPNDDKLYFVQRNPISLNQESNKEDFNIQLWWGRDKNVKNMMFSELNEFVIYNKLYPGQLIYLTTKDGSGFCYVSGYTGGRLDIKSALGDGIDLICNNMSGKVKPQYQIAISTIKSIEKITINNLGEIGKRF